ncbi:MAG: 4-hydroxythreonine-4-phosphate dehydrogenase PdxA [Pseudomonadales bacterium]|nr:4-hydroxythreonine-4-phosphate dehydrogenase PdxA [Pseudomonadales bacterium]
MSKSASRPILAITPGEPAGIGPDLALSVARHAIKQHIKGANKPRLLLIADPDLLHQCARSLHFPTVPINTLNNMDDWNEQAINVYPIKLRTPSVAGKLNPTNAHYVLETLELAVTLCLSGICQGMVTGPVHKACINDAGISFSGHTEWLAARMGQPQVVMMLTTPSLKVALATTHLPLREVADAIQGPALEQTLAILHKELQQHFGFDEPKILVCGLNPHAGENGHMGREEIDIIIPALAAAKTAGIHVSGPVPADTAFTEKSLSNTDIVLAMFHDQGLPVLKHQGFGQAANVTLGLPIIRTSVDHGTALELAGSGNADDNSLRTAIECAASMADCAAHFSSSTFQLANNDITPRD